MSLVPSTYTPYSYADYAVDGGAVTTATTVFSFPKQFLLLDHLQAWHRTGSGVKTWTQLSGAQAVFTGTSGSGTLTLQGSAPARSTGDIIRIVRVTPAAAVDRIVSFVPGSLSSADLNTAQLQNLYLLQEIKDLMVLRLGLEAVQEVDWDAQAKRITNLAAPLAATDAARLQDLTDVVLAAGSLPGVNDADNGSSLIVSSGAWSLATAEEMRVLLGFGSVSERDVGTGADNVSDNTLGDARWLKQSQNLADLGSAATARTNLGIPSSNPAALLQTTDEGIAASRVVELDALSRYPAADGRNIDLTSHPLVAGGTGRIGAVGRYRIGAYAQTFSTTPAIVEIPAQTPEEILNSGADITLDTALNQITLKIGTYLVFCHLEWVNADAANKSNVRWYLRRDVGGAGTLYHTQEASTVPPSVGGVEFPITQTAFRLLTVTSSTEIIDILADEVIGVSSGDPRIRFGTLLIMKVSV